MVTMAIGRLHLLHFADVVEETPVWETGTQNGLAALVPIQGWAQSNWAQSHDADLCQATSTERGCDNTVLKFGKCSCSLARIFGLHSCKHVFFQLENLFDRVKTLHHCMVVRPDPLKLMLPRTRGTGTVLASHPLQEGANADG